MARPFSKPPVSAPAPAEGGFARAIRLWLDYHRRCMEFGFHPF